MGSQVAFNFLISACLVGCVSVTTVNPERDKYLPYSCEQLQAELQRVGAIQTDAQNDQGVTATQAFGEVLTLGIARPINMTRAKNADVKAEQQIRILYEIWDEKRCAAEMYEKNKNAPTNNQ